MGCRSCGKHTTKESASTILTAEQTLVKEQKPIVDSKGGLTFTKIAPTMVDYVHDPANPKRLIPDEVPCRHRITLPVLGQSGTWVMNQCNCIGCPLRGQTVDKEVCRECDHREEYSKKTLLGDSRGED